MYSKWKHGEVYLHCTNGESFYCPNRIQLGEYWHCATEDQKAFCPEKCDDCDVCKKLAEVFENLKDSCFFSPNEHGHQTVLWRVFF